MLRVGSGTGYPAGLQDSKKNAKDIDMQMNYYIIRTLRAEIMYVNAKLEELKYYRMKLINLRKFITCNKIYLSKYYVFIFR
jgi:hypothetical protein